MGTIWPKWTDSFIVWEHSARGAGAAGRDVGETESL